MTIWAEATELDDPTNPYSESSIQIASQILYKLTGEKFQGVHTVTEKYNPNASSSSHTTPALINGNMYNIPRSAGNDGKLYLRHRPVREIIEIVEMGSVLPQTSFELRNRTFVVKKNRTPWLSDYTNELEVTYSYGAKPPLAGKLAAIKLANELNLSMVGSSDCALPSRVSSVARQGVQITMLDPQEFLEQGRTGLYEVDLFLKTYNPDKAKKKSKLFVAGRPRGERVN